MIANEAIGSLLKNNKCGVICKPSIEKAYDNVNWNFLLAILRKMGFSERWIGCIRWCISTMSFSMIINGTPSSFFRISQGLRQGDPLSPCLFVIAMKAFSSLISKTGAGGYLTSWRVRGRGGEGVEISHLLFANDTVVFCEPDEDQLTHLCNVLMWFETLFGLNQLAKE